MKTRVLAAITTLVCIFAVIVSMASPASATVGSIHHGYDHEVGLDPGYWAWAYFGSGTGSIRAYLGCASGNEAWVIYGLWIAYKNVESTTDECAQMYTYGYNTRS